MMEAKQTNRRPVLRWVVLGLVLVAVGVGAVIYGVMQDEDDNQPIFVERRETLSLELVEGEVHLVVTNTVGSITILGDQGAEGVVVNVTKRGQSPDRDRATRYADNQQATIERNENTYTVRGSSREPMRYGMNESANLDLRIVVPPQVNITVTVEVGGIEIRRVEIQDALNLTAGVGSIMFDGVIGPHGTHAINTDVGSIDLFMQPESAFALDAATETGSLVVELDGLQNQAGGVSASVRGVYHGAGVDDLATLTLRADVGSISILD